MSGCERFEELIERYLAGDIQPADLDELRQHASRCPGCRRLMELHRELSELSGQTAYVSDERFDEIRAAVLSRIRPHPGRANLPFWRRWSLALIPQPVSTILAVVALVGLGFMAGRLTSARTGFDESMFVREVVRQASLERGLAGYWDSPFIYSNVSLRPGNDGRVAIDFDVTRHVNVTKRLDSPLTREILVHAMLDPSTMGARFNAMGVASQAMDSKLREALIFILRNDPSMPVRLRALETLVPHVSEPNVQDALLASLTQDPSVQIRLLAVESLAGKHTDPRLIRKALGEPLDDNDRAVFYRAAELLGDS